MRKGLLCEDLLQREMPLGAAVSGGADSIALLHLLVERGWRPVVLHVNHGLRGTESDADQHFVSRMAARLGCPFFALEEPLEPGNREQAARKARYRWFRQLIGQGTVGQVATAHTEDDQAETVLFRFLRGSGTAGLSGIRAETLGIVRPLLKASREALREYLTAREIAWREDSSNASLQFRRNRIRHELLPALTEHWNPNLTATLAQTAEWAQAEEAYWQEQVRRITKNWVRFEKNSAEFELGHLHALPVAAARRVIRHLIEHVQGSLRGVEFAQVERVLALAARQPGDGGFETGKWQARRSGRSMRISPLDLPAADYRVRLAVPGVFALPHQPVAIRLELKPTGNVYNDVEQQADWALISGALHSGSLELRSWQPGDRFQQAGHKTHRKLKHLLQEAGIPSWQRFGWPVITCENTMVWTRGQGVASPFRPSAAASPVLHIEEVSNETPNQKRAIERLSF